MYTSLVATSETLRQLIEDSMAADIGPGGLANFFAQASRVVSLATPEEMAGRQQGLSLWLYRVVRDEHRLNDPPVLRPRPTGRVDLVPPPLPLRLHYLVTPLTRNSPDTEQRILGRVLQLVHSRPIVSGAALRETWPARTRRSTSGWKRCRSRRSPASGRRSRAPTSSRSPTRCRWPASRASSSRCAPPWWSRRIPTWR
jgi:hypothetical protein